jgi:hypothetical protein
MRNIDFKASSPDPSGYCPIEIEEEELVVVSRPTAQKKTKPSRSTTHSIPPIRPKSSRPKSTVKSNKGVSHQIYQLTNYALLGISLVSSAVVVNLLSPQIETRRAEFEMTNKEISLQSYKDNLKVNTKSNEDSKYKAHYDRAYVIHSKGAGTTSLMQVYLYNVDGSSSTHAELFGNLESNTVYIDVSVDTNQILSAKKTAFPPPSSLSIH